MPVRGFLIVAKNIVNTCVHIGKGYIYLFLYTAPPPQKKIKNKNPAEILFTGRVDFITLVFQFWKYHMYAL